MEHHFVNKVSRFFPSSFTSCQFRSLPDVVHSSIPITKTINSIHHKTKSPKPFSDNHRNPSKIESQIPKTTLKIDKKVPKKSLLLGSDAEGRIRCPPVTPVSVMPSSKKKERTKQTSTISSSNSTTGRWFSSDNEEADQFDGKSDTFFSLSSCSSESFRLKTAKNNAKRLSIEVGRCSSALSAYSVNTALSQCSLKTTKSVHEITGKHGKKPEISYHGFVKHDKTLKGRQVFEASTELYYSDCRKTSKSRWKTANIHHRRQRRRAQMVRFDKGGKFSNAVEDSYAIEKSSSDPYNDFRTSMVEMIIEKQIFGVKDLEKLLDCFLSLNSSGNHGVILEVFREICDTLFAS